MTPAFGAARSAAAFTLFALACTAFSAPLPARDVPETLHGVTVHDPYRYLENIKDPQVQDWLKAEGLRARQALDQIPGREAMEKRIAELSAGSGDSLGEIVRMPGGKTFYLKRARGERQYKLVLREGGHERVLVNPQAEADRTGIAHAINYFVPSWDGRHVAYGLSAGGSEDASLHIMEVASGRRVGDPIPRVREPNVSWLPDSRSITYNQLRALGPEDADTETYLDSSVMWLKLGEPASQARAVFGPTVTKQLGLDRLDVGGIVFAPGSRWMVARTTDTTQRESSLFIARVEELGRGTPAWKRIAAFDDKIVEIELQGEHLYYRTRQGAPRYRIMKLDLRAPELARAQELAVPPEGGVIESFAMGRGETLMASVRDGTAIKLRLYGAGDRRGQAVKLPFVGAARLHDDPAHAYGDWLYTLSGWTRPPQTLRLAGGVSTDAGLRPPAKLAAGPAIEIVDVKVPSHDGALVPMTLIYKKGLKRDGGNPTLLTAYGSYGLSETANFNPARLAWLERGGVLAIANVRGSGVYGEPWRMAGFKASKPNTWKDGVACAQYLIAQGYASPRTLAAMGTSAGGIFVGRSVTTAPQLFAAAIFNVGVMDAVRAEDSANGITNISEFGSYRNPREFPALLEMSTYHQIRDGVPYPAVLLVHGMNDPRVDVWHSAKAAARLQAASSSGKPVLLRLDGQAGHGVGSTATQRNALWADIYSFLLWQMGKAGPQ
ncbi:prolyl oligopeptidase family serine peptidase [Ramlibacter solisilvae]|uniref:prolyl oligopeptidase n=1 Tax=Ramlibacter tataouinensis TaxID=94132 RepID=A0A127JYQ3_9BURK|nr:prolyl oligopeptidase family serine peptidase [Ramlibacter tataouinensis]AMO23232.1 hypothetical protein UC35_10425 [Ramlibacter tataouinensis]